MKQDTEEDTFCPGSKCKRVNVLFKFDTRSLFFSNNLIFSEWHFLPWRKCWRPPGETWHTFTLSWKDNFLSSLIPGHKPPPPSQWRDSVGTNSQLVCQQHEESAASPGQETRRIVNFQQGLLSIIFIPETFYLKMFLRRHLIMALC